MKIVSLFFFLILFIVRTDSVSADCSTPLVAGDYSMEMEWRDSFDGGHLLGKLELGASGNAVLRGARLLYKNSFGRVTEVEGFARGQFGMAQMCTGFLNLSLTERSSNSVVGEIETYIVASGDRVDTNLSGFGSASITVSDSITRREGLFVSVSLKKMRL